MKKYIAYAPNGKNSGFLTQVEASEWARDCAKKHQVKVLVCEIISVAERPVPDVVVRPFVYEENV